MHLVESDGELLVGDLVNNAVNAVAIATGPTLVPITLEKPHDVSRREHPQLVLKALPLTLVLLLLSLFSIRQAALFSPTTQVEQHAPVNTCGHMVHKQFGHRQIALF